jgi:hypothetical protein
MSLSLNQGLDHGYLGSRKSLFMAVISEALPSVATTNDDIHCFVKRYFKPGKQPTASSVYGRIFMCVWNEKARNLIC